MPARDNAALRRRRVGSHTKTGATVKGLEAGDVPWTGAPDPEARLVSPVRERCYVLPEEELHGERRVAVCL